MFVYLVRHGDAGQRRAWPEQDRLRPLTATGRLQAEGVASHLAPCRPVQILSSPYVRCEQTVMPLSARIGIRVDPTDELAEGNGKTGADLARALLEDPRYDRVVLCTHGDVLSEILLVLAGDYSLDLGSAPRQEKGSIWHLQVGERGWAATYLPPAAR
jgi:8-oxo-dGTP diphosphatase